MASIFSTPRLCQIGWMLLQHPCPIFVVSSSAKQPSFCRAFMNPKALSQDQNAQPQDDTARDRVTGNGTATGFIIKNRYGIHRMNPHEPGASQFSRTTCAAVGAAGGGSRVQGCLRTSVQRTGQGLLKKRQEERLKHMEYHGIVLVK